MRSFLTLVVCVAALVACGGRNDPGTMTSQQYRSLKAQQSSLSIDEVKATGGAQGAKLERRWADEGGPAAQDGLDCLYAATTYRTRYRGMARFCFDDGGQAVSVDRNRSDLPDSQP